MAPHPNYTLIILNYTVNTFLCRNARHYASFGFLHHPKYLRPIYPYYYHSTKGQTRRPGPSARAEIEQSPTETTRSSVMPPKVTSDSKLCFEPSPVTGYRAGHERHGVLGVDFSVATSGPKPAFAVSRGRVCRISQPRKTALVPPSWRRKRAFAMKV
ncbi:hypothetical protein PENSPDRAFT_54513 [Peniophora sp. CONT]|nr:hypothetical protein PENSPDRAFT_54513 [Peniophora sp. CONT]